MTDDIAPPPGAPEGTEPSASPSSASPGPVVPTNAAPAKRKGPGYAFLALVSLATLAADLGTKAWAKAHLEDPRAFPPKRVEILKDHIELVFARNKGGAWGILQGESEAIRKPFFLLVSVAAVVFIVSLYRKLTPQQTALKWGLPLVLGGALGNLCDRIRYDHVVDFIDVFWKHQHWPTFNIADVAICVGVGLMAVDMFTSRKPNAPAAAKAAPKPAPAETGEGEPHAASGLEPAPADAAHAGPAEGA